MLKSTPTCPACGHDAWTFVVAVPSVPVFCNVLLSSAQAARTAPLGDVELVQCDTCGLLVNAAFEPDLVGYEPGYENSLHHSDTFQRWATALAHRLVDDHGLQGRTAVEVGCGGGGFLALLVDAGIAKAIGYDPSAVASSCVDGVDIRHGFLDASDRHDADLVVCRHVLEHVPDPRALLEIVAGAAPSGVVYVEVPDAATMLRTGRIYDVIYEHCSYFAAPAMAALLDRLGLRPLRLRAEFDGQFLCVDAVRDVRRCRPASAFDVEDVRAMRAVASDFGVRTAEGRQAWAERLAAASARGEDVVVWGAGSKGVTFVNIVEGGETVSRLVDVNPAKRGRFVPGTAQPVVAPIDLVERAPDVVVAMNPMYVAEIEEQLSQLGLHAEVLVA